MDSKFITSESFTKAMEDQINQIQDSGCACKIIVSKTSARKVEKVTQSQNAAAYKTSEKTNAVNTTEFTPKSAETFERVGKVAK